jgi:hypothetical protein
MPPNDWSMAQAEQPSHAKEGGALKTKWTLTFCCCAVLVGCGTVDTISHEFHKLTNPFGTPFQDATELRAHILVGTPVEKAQEEMNIHGFEQLSAQQHGDTLTLAYRPYDVGGLRAAAANTWVTIRCERGVVVDVECHFDTGVPPASSAGGK